MSQATCNGIQQTYNHLLLSRLQLSELNAIMLAYGVKDYRSCRHVDAHSKPENDASYKREIRS